MGRGRPGRPLSFFQESAAANETLIGLCVLWEELAVSELLMNGQVVFWGAIVLICIVPSIAHYWWKARQAEIDAELKRQMLERGMSAEEIRTVLESSTQGAKKRACG